MSVSCVAGSDVAFLSTVGGGAAVDDAGVGVDVVAASVVTNVDVDDAGGSDLEEGAGIVVVWFGAAVGVALDDGGGEGAAAAGDVSDDMVPTRSGESHPAGIY